MNNNQISRVISRSTEVCKEDIDTGMVVKDAQESEDNKSCIICDKMFIETKILDKYFDIWIFILFEYMQIYVKLSKITKSLIFKITQNYKVHILYFLVFYNFDFDIFFPSIIVFFLSKYIWKRGVLTPKKGGRLWWGRVRHTIFGIYTKLRTKWYIICLVTI